ncbi:MAG TPA: hypothetical protein PLJ38_11375, partial [bacterium]|nr:hypothetical protein [bacterium]
SAFDTITINQFDTPVITITIPTTDTRYITINTSITIAGTFSELDYYDSIVLWADTLQTGVFVKLADSYIISPPSGFWQFSNIALNAQYNTFVVETKNQFFDTQYDTIAIRQLPPPDIAITFPTNNYDTKSEIITIIGTTINTSVGDTVLLYVDSGVGLILVNDTILVADDGSWADTVCVNIVNCSVVAVINTAQGLQDSYSITINQFDLPQIFITNYGDTLYTKDTITILSGITNNIDIGDTIYIRNDSNGIINTIIISDTLAMSAVWSGTVSVTEFGARVSVIFQNQWNDTAYDTITIWYFDEPSIKITYPANNIDTSVQNIVVSGTTYYTADGGLDEVFVYVNGVLNNSVKILDFNGNWSTNITLNNIGDSVVAKLVDQFGRIKYDTITINYYPPPEV